MRPTHRDSLHAATRILLKRMAGKICFKQVSLNLSSEWIFFKWRMVMAYTNTGMFNWRLMRGIWIISDEWRNLIPSRESETGALKSRNLTSRELTICDMVPSCPVSRCQVSRFQSPQWNKCKLVYVNTGEWRLGPKRHWGNQIAAVCKLIRNVDHWETLRVFIVWFMYLFKWGNEAYKKYKQWKSKKQTCIYTYKKGRNAAVNCKQNTWNNSRGLWCATCMKEIIKELNAYGMRSRCLLHVFGLEVH